MKFWKKVTYLPISVALALLNSACGGQAYNNAQDPSLPSTAITPGASAPWLTTPTPAATSTSTSGANPAISKSFTLQGTGGYNTNYPFSPNYTTSVTYTNISADSKLSVNLVPNSGSSSTSGSAIVQAQYLGGSANYTGCVIYSDCVRVRVQIIDHATQLQIGADQFISANVTTTDGSGSCGTGTAGPSYDFSNDVLSSGHGSVDIVLSQISSDLYYNSCVYGTIYNHDLKLLPYNDEESATLMVHTDTTQ